MYLVYGDNGIIIQELYSEAYRCRRYFQRAQIKHYDTLGEAVDAAREILAEILPHYVPVPDVIELDVMLTVRKIVEEYMRMCNGGRYEN